MYFDFSVRLMSLRNCAKISVLCFSDLHLQKLSCICFEMVTMEKGTVLVTGGAGFLGQHVVELFQSNADYVTDIRIFDIEPYINKLGYQERKPVKSIIGSVLDNAALQEACKGVDAVFHLTGCVDTRMFPDVQKLNAVNVQGTENLIQACKKGNVKRLVYCSTVDVVIGKEGHVFNGTETTTSIPHKGCFFSVHMLKPNKKLRNLFSRPTEVT